MSAQPAVVEVKNLVPVFINVKISSETPLTYHSMHHAGTIYLHDTANVVFALPEGQLIVTDTNTYAISHKNAVDKMVIETVPTNDVIDNILVPGTIIIKDGIPITLGAEMKVELSINNCHVVIPKDTYLYEYQTLNKVLTNNEWNAKLIYRLPEVNPVPVVISDRLKWLTRIMLQTIDEQLVNKKVAIDNHLQKQNELLLNKIAVTREEKIFKAITDLVMNEK